eukprot:TRINITY_DN22869_c0_g1_i2.p1 TRINITY_DN22869_c0_g1~~TRINITY_DN22869_c0_g1_i2.p1  ORF type:complete len:759 (-),score=103.92 TRINITY_DN22869_c0_g1_i2:191-2467(-)
MSCSAPASRSKTSRSSDVEFSNIAEAAKLQYTHVVAEMLASGADVDAQDGDGNTALHWSCSFGLESLTSLLLAHDARTDVVNRHGDAPVHHAAKARSLSGLRLLSSDKGAHSSPAVFFMRDGRGRTASLLLAEANDASLLEWLYMQGGSLEDRDAEGRTALHLASELGHTRTLQWLLSRSVSLVECTTCGQSPLHLAAGAGNQDTAKMLLEAGAGHLLSSRDLNNQDPVDLARQNGHWMLLLWLLRARVCLGAAAWLGTSKNGGMEPETILRPAASQSVWSVLFLGVVMVNVLVYVLVITPELYQIQLRLVLSWPVLTGGVLALWLYTATSDPGWSCPRTVWDQGTRARQQDKGAQSALAVSLRSQEQQMDHLLKKVQELSSLADQQSTTNTADSSTFSRGMTRISPADPSEVSWTSPKVHQLEQQQLELARQCHLFCALLRATGSSESSSQTNASEGGSWQLKLDHCSQVMQDLSQGVFEEVREARKKELHRLGRAEYLRFVEEGDFRNVCVICHSERDMRSFHCKQCGRCVHRLDHHCPWVDKCIGLANQRVFYLFLLVLFFALAVFYMLGCIFVSRSFLEPRALLAKDISVIFALVLDTVAGLFVGALILRQTAYMLVNVTTYEVLVSPPHIQQRFPSRNKRFWYLSDCRLTAAIRNVVTYWTLDMSYDAIDYGEDSLPGLEECCSPCHAGGEDAHDLLSSCWKGRSVGRGVSRAEYGYEQSSDLGSEDPSVQESRDGAGFNSRTVLLPPYRQGI